MKIGHDDRVISCGPHDVPTGYGCPDCYLVVPSLLGHVPWWAELWLSALFVVHFKSWLFYLPAIWLAGACLRALLGIPWLQCDWWAFLAASIWGASWAATRVVVHSSRPRWKSD